MEDVLDVYQEPEDPTDPWVCFDEKPVPLRSSKREPLSAEPGQPVRYDYEYVREGRCNLFLLLSPKSAWRHVVVTERRTASEFADQMKWLVSAYPKAKRIRVVLDNLNTHKMASLYERFEPQEAREIARRLEFHYTPKHGSWLNMAEIEWSIFERQCLNQRIPSQSALKQAVDALQKERNEARAKINWQFTCQDARRKLHRLYPSIST